MGGTHVLLFIVLLVATCSYYILYGSKGVLLQALSPKNPDIEWLLTLVMRYLLGILRDAMILWTIAIVCRESHWVSDAMQYWLRTLIGSVGIILFSLLIRHPLEKNTIYQQLFPVTQGENTLLLGMLAVILLAEPIKRYGLKSGVVKFAMLALWLPLVFNKDIFYLTWAMRR